MIWHFHTECMCSEMEVSGNAERKMKFNVSPISINLHIHSSLELTMLSNGRKKKLGTSFIEV